MTEAASVPGVQAAAAESLTAGDNKRWATHQLLSMAARSVERRWDGSLARIGLTHAGVLALKGLIHAGPVTQETLAAAIRVKGQTLGQVLARLEAAAFITRHRSETDRRSKLVMITEQGRQVLCAAQESERDLLPARFRTGTLHRELTALMSADDAPRQSTRPTEAASLPPPSKL